MNSYSYIEVDARTLLMPKKTVGLDACAVKMVDPKRVAAVQAELLPEEELRPLTELFRLLGDVTRARLLYALLEGGELCVCDLSAATGMPETNVSHALRLLRTAGIVKARRDGRMMHYSLHDAHVRMLLDLSREHLRHTAGGQ
jgi:DNA-binding transcriptional ArsR family regulator